MRRAIVLVALCTVALPRLAVAQEEGPSDWWDDQGEGAPDESPPVDVNVGVSVPGASIGISTFQQPLASYGQWLDLPGYGNVWRPAGVAAGWRPYYYGRWEWTSEGWLWVTDEPWGWATYHYGRWAYDPGYGWIWVPGYQWAPAWVTWRYGPDSVGWAPLAPGFSVYVSSYPVAMSWWTFMPCDDFVGRPVYRYAYGPRDIDRYWRYTRPAPPRAALYGHAAPAWGGPARGFIETRVGRPVVPVRVHPVGSPAAASGMGRGGMVPIFRPEGRAAPRAFVPGSPGAPGRGSPGGFAPGGPGAGSPRGFAPGAPGRGRPEGVAPRGQFPQGPGGAPPQRSAPVQPAPSQPGNAPRGRPEGQPRSWGPAPSQPNGPRYAAPRYSAPQAPRFSAPRFSAPQAPRFSAPRYSAPQAARFSAPQAPAARGGWSQGGGRGRPHER